MGAPVSGIALGAFSREVSHNASNIGFAEPDFLVSHVPTSTVLYWCRNGENAVIRENRARNPTVPLVESFTAEDDFHAVPLNVDPTPAVTGRVGYQ